MFERSVITSYKRREVTALEAKNYKYTPQLLFE